MDMFVVGNIIGRLLVAYLVVWFVCFVFSRFNYKKSAQKTHSKVGLIAVSLLFLLPMLSQTGSYV